MTPDQQHQVKLCLVESHHIREGAEEKGGEGGGGTV